MVEVDSLRVDMGTPGYIRTIVVPQKYMKYSKEDIENSLGVSWLKMFQEDSHTKVAFKIA